MPVTSRRPLLARFAWPLLCAAAFSTLIPDAQAVSATAGLTGRTNKSGGAGCSGGGCHSDQAQDGASMSVVISGPSYLAPGVTGSYSVTATKATLGAGARMGVNIASTEGGTSLSESAANLVVANGEIVHSAPTGTINTTDGNGSAAYGFSYTMPAAASLGSAHTLYAVSRLGFSGGWKHAANFGVTAATAPGAPTIGAATAGNAQASVSFGAPASNGGVTISNYTATCSAAGQITRSNTGTVSPIVVASLTNAITYSCSVTATNPAGTSAASGSASATPQLPGVAPQITSAAATTFTVGIAGSFTVTRSGTPTPTLVLSGSLPNGVTFNAGSGVLSGTPASGSAGTWPVTISATNATAPDATQNFTLTVVRQNQTISFAGPAGQAFAATPVALVASASSSLAVSFSSSTPAVCSISASSALLISAGVCTITALQSGNGTYNAAADVTRSFTLSPVVPGAPAIGTATPGNGQATVGFSAPAFNGGTPVTGYTVTCNPGARTGSGSTSPITVSGMTNGTPYSCSVMATNGVGPGAASTTVAVTPTSGPVAPIITSGNSLTLALGATASRPVNATGTPNPTLSISGTLPAGMSFVPVAGSSNPATATLGGTPAFGSAGTYPLTITASNGTLPNATQPFTLTVQKLNQTINAVSPPSPQFFAGGAVPLSAAASSLLPVSFTSDSPFTCSITGSSAIMQAAGTCSINVNQAGNSNYNAAPTVSISFAFQASSQTVSFPAQVVGTRTFVDGGTFAINPLATSSSGLPVVYSANGNCTISGSTVTMITSPGSCQITASQPGDSRVLPATQVAQFIQINPGPPGAPSISSFTASSGFATFNLTAPASDGGSQLSSVAVTCTPGPISQSQSIPLFGIPPPVDLFGFVDGTPYSCTATASNAIGESVASAPVTFTTGPTANGQNLFQNNCTFSCHSNFIPTGTILNAAGTTGTVLAYARSNVFQMSNDFQLAQLSASDLAAIAAYIKQQLPPIAPSTTQDSAVSIDVGSHLTLDTVSFKQIEVVDPPASGTLSAFSGTGVTYMPNPGFAGIDSFSYRGVRGDVQPPLLGDARTVIITVIGTSYFLSVGNTAGGFTGNTVTGSGIDCGFDCSQSYNSGTVVTLTPQPAFGYIFTGWGGDCSGSGTCSVTMSANRNVTANFEPGYTVTPSAGANGSISPATPQGVTTGATRSFTITANAGYSASVGGSCGGVLSGNVFTTFGVSFDCTVTATFLRNPVTFNIVFEGQQNSPPGNSLAFGSGTINVNTDAKTISYSLTLNGLSGAITDMFVQGPAVRGNVGPARQNLNANPTFGSFSYSPADEADILAGLWYIRVSTAAYPSGEVRAQIDALGATPRYVVTVVKAGTGSGTVTGNVGGINCGLVCTANIAQGVFVLLTPTPDAGSVFSGWSFGCGSSGNCALLASADTTVTATFSPIPPDYTVTPSAGPGGSISPATPQTVAGGNQTTFTITPNAGFYANVGGTCFGTYSPPIFVTVAITGNCTIEVTFVQFATVPDAPTIGSASAGDGQLSIAFTAPGFDGNAAITSYQATCNPGARTGSATVSPVTVSGLTNNTLYTCSVAAINSLGTGAASGTVSATPQPSLAILSVTSSRMHGALGPFPITLDTSKSINEAVTVEPRAIGSGHRIVFTFNNPITSSGSLSLVNTPGPSGSAAAVINGNSVVVTLTGLADNARATVALTGVNNTLNASVSIGFLAGDVNGTRAVTASDLSAIKASIAGSQPVTVQNFRHDVNTSGTISGSDLSAARVRAGQILR